MSFDPTKQRCSFEDFVWKYEIALDRGTLNKPGNAAQASVGEIAVSHLVSCEGKLLPILPSRIRWIDEAVAAAEESFGESLYYHSRLYEARALARWFSESSAAEDDWSKAFDHRQAYFRERDQRTKGWVRFQLLDDLMADALQAGRHGDAIATFEAHFSGSAFRLKSAQHPRQIAYAHALNAVSPRFERAELLQAGRRMLQKYLEPEWLHNGQYLRAAKWLKIVYWHDNPALTPKQVMLKAYDDMPQVQRPDWLE